MSLVRHLVRDTGDFKIDIPEWTLPDQGIVALWGPSGSGKTSVMRILLGLDPCPGLEWIFKGQDLAKLPTPKRELGVVFQSLELFPHLSAEDNIWFGARARGYEDEKAKKLFSELVETLGLKDQLQQRSDTLSGGERQRVALARALMVRPRMLFLDEPFSSLDQTLKSEARELLKQVVGAQSFPTLLITHDPRDLAELACEVVQIRNGKLVSA